MKPHAPFHKRIENKSADNTRLGSKSCSWKHVSLWEEWFCAHNLLTLQLQQFFCANLLILDSVSIHSFLHGLNWVCTLWFRLVNFLPISKAHLRGSWTCTASLQSSFWLRDQREIACRQRWVYVKRHHLKDPLALCHQDTCCKPKVFLQTWSVGLLIQPVQPWWRLEWCFQPHPLTTKPVHYRSENGTRISKWKDFRLSGPRFLGLLGSFVKNLKLKGFKWLSETERLMMAWLEANVLHKPEAYVPHHH